MLSPLVVTNNSIQLKCIDTDICGDYYSSLGLSVARGVSTEVLVVYLEKKQDRDLVRRIVSHKSTLLHKCYDCFVALRLRYLLL